MSAILRTEHVAIVDGRASYVRAWHTAHPLLDQGLTYVGILPDVPGESDTEAEILESALARGMREIADKRLLEAWDCPEGKQ